MLKHDVAMAVQSKLYVNMVGEDTFMEMVDKHITLGHAYIDLFATYLLYLDTFRSRRIPDRKPSHSTDGQGDINIRGSRTSKTNW